ncbi:MAG: M48 family metallopeptidase [Armatimonadota bacterium]|nr:M48 family metallopeptidase [Armatimonadota bacterium]
MYTSTLTIDQLRDPKEKKAAAWLTVFAVPVWLFVVLWVVGTLGLGLIFIGLFVLVTMIAELFVVAYIKTNAVRVSERQLPEVYEAVRNACARLNIHEPDVYVLQQGIWNALAMKIAGRRLVVLLSGAVDSILLKGDMQQLAWLIGHEIGHHAAGHLDFWRRRVEMGGGMIWVYLWYQRRCELTCDRIGLYCAGSLESSSLAVANMTVGAQLASRVNIDEAIRQWNEHRHEFFVQYRTIYSSHPHTLWRLEEMRLAAKSFGMLETAWTPSQV